MVAALPVYGAAHGIDHEPARHRLALHLGINFLLWIKDLLSRAVGYQLDAPEQAEPADVAYMVGDAKQLDQAELQLAATLPHLFHTVLAADGHSTPQPNRSTQTGKSGGQGMRSD